MVFEEALIGEVQLHSSVGEQDEGGWCDVGLRHIKNFHPLPHRNGGAFEIHRLQEAIHFARADALAPLARNFLQQREDFLDVLASAGRDEQRRRVVKELQRSAQTLKIEILIIRPLRILNAGCASLTDGAFLSGCH